MWTFNAGQGTKVDIYKQLYRQIKAAETMPENVGVAILEAATFLIATARSGETIDAVQCEVMRDMEGRFHYNLSVSP